MKDAAGYPGMESLEFAPTTSVLDRTGVQLAKELTQKMQSDR